jgi:LuxR family transcriptional regulator, maltose regulon positive regulatory protein
MTRKTAMVSAVWPTGEQILYGEQTDWRDIRLDSAQWFAWLETPEHRSFSYALMNHAKGYIDGFMTVRKECRQRGGAYWTAYRRQGHTLRKVYLGPASALTAARLAEAAQRLYTPDGPSP